MAGQSSGTPSLPTPPEEIWRDYNRRADMENRIAELKHDLGADRFCLKDFHATDAVFRSVLLFNLLREFRRASGLPQHKEPGTLRSQVFLCGAELTHVGTDIVLSLSTGWGRTSAAHLPSLQHLELGFPNLAEVAAGRACLTPNSTANSCISCANFGIQVEKFGRVPAADLCPIRLGSEGESHVKGFDRFPKLLCRHAQVSP